MTRTLFLTCAAAAALLCGIAVADERAVAQDHDEIRKIARTELPINERATFEAEIEHLAEVLSAKVQCPAPKNYVRDIVLGHELEFVFDLLREWPAVRFREPLAEFFATRQEWQVECGEALLAYRDDALTLLVNSHDGVLGQVGKDRYVRQQDDRTDFIRNARLWADRYEFRALKPFVSLDGLLPKCRMFHSNKLDWSRGMTVDAAIRQLHDPDLSIRLQSWSWLAERGIVAPTNDIVDVWPHLNDEHRSFISELRPRFVGRARLLHLFEDLAEISSEFGFVQDRLVVR